jgi:hypothetical protein
VYLQPICLCHYVESPLRGIIGSLQPVWYYFYEWYFVPFSRKWQNFHWENYKVCLEERGGFSNLNICLKGLISKWWRKRLWSVFIISFSPLKELSVAATIYYRVSTIPSSIMYLPNRCNSTLDRRKHKYHYSTVVQISAFRFLFFLFLPKPIIISCMLRK